MPSTTLSPTEGRFTSDEVCGLLKVEPWILSEMILRRVLAPQANDKFSEFDIARCRTDSAVVAFVSKLRKQKSSIEALRVETAGRTLAGKKAARESQILKPNREDALEAKVQQLTDTVEKLVQMEEARQNRLKKQD